MTFGSAFLFQFHPHLQEVSQILEVSMRNFPNKKIYKQLSLFVNIHLFSQEYIPFIIEEKVTEES